ncbi:MAG: magnesium transporter [Alphaproteobacteria bacterium]|nr:magnesium transporter [Alphaproteobacteria bacterium]
MNDHPPDTHGAESDSSVDEFLITDEEIREITTAVRAQDSDTVHGFLEDLSGADTAELLSKVSDEDRDELLFMYGDALDPLVFTELDPELRRKALSSMPPAVVAGILSALESDDALDLIINLDETLQQEIIRKLSVKRRLAVEEGLSFPEDSAGRLMQREVVAIPQFWTAGKTIDYLRNAAADLPEDFFDIFVVDPSYHVTGQIPLNKLVRADRSALMDSLKLEDIHPIPATMDQEEVAHIFRREDAASAPVVDRDGRLIGVITIDDVIDVIDEEAQEDILRLAGVEHGDLYRAVWATTGTRFRWLFLNLLTAIMASVVISFFDATLEQIVALAILMPIVASMGGNAGTQALTVAVRALATRELSGANAWRIIWKEGLVGMLNGLAFALIAGVVTALWFDNNMVLGAVIASAMAVNLFAAGIFGAGIPIFLDRIGSDPAISSTVFLTTVTDVIGFFAFLGLATIFLV